MKLLCTRLPLLLLLLLLGCNGGGDATRNIDFIPLRSIAITSQNPQAAAGTTNRFTAIGHYGDSTTYQYTRDLTSQVVWTSSAPAELTFSSDPAANGLATMGAAATTVTVTATLDTIHGELAFAITDATLTGLTVPTPAKTSLSAGETLQLRATGTFSDATSQDLTETVAWSSSAPTVATVDTTVPGSGLVTALTLGNTTITATSGTFSATQALTVNAATLSSLAVKSADGTSSRALGTTMRLLATGTYSDTSQQDLTSQVTWTSGNAAVATFDQNAGLEGRLTPIKAGTTTVTASLDGRTSPGFTVTVNTATLTTLSISPASTTLAVGQSLALKATGDFSTGSTQDVSGDVLWSSADTAIATVSMSSGVEGTVKGVAAGKVAITANSNKIPTTSGSASTASANVTIQ